MKLIRNAKQPTLIGIALVLALTFTACSGSEPSSESSSLTNTSWALFRLNGESLIDSTQITIKFDGEIFNGSSGCNDYGSPYTASQNTLVSKGLNSSTKLCESPTGIMQQEQIYLKMFEKSLTYQLVEGQLMFTNTNGESVLEFRLLNG